MLSTEQDPDVSAAAREAVLKLDKIEVVMETLSRRSMFEEDMVDQKKEDEERLLEEREQSEMSLARQGSDARRKISLKDDKITNKKGTSVSNNKKYGRQELRKSISKEGKTVTNKSVLGTKGQSSSSANGAGISRMTSMTSALHDLASCSSPVQTSTSKRVSGPSLVTVKTTNNNTPHRTNPKRNSLPGTASKPSTRTTRSQSTGKR